MRRSHLVAVSVLLLSFPASAVADDNALCGQAPDSCEVRTEAWVREGTTVPVTVRGNGGTRVQVDLQLARPDGDGVAFEPVTSRELLVGRQGISTLDVVLPALEPAAEGGWVYVGVGDEVGTYVPFGARVPVILGDGYALAKPVGERINLRFTGAIPGSHFAVEYQDSTGRWQDCSDGQPDVAASPDGVSSLHYVVPRGLIAEPHRFRLRNTSDSAPPLEWDVVPSEEGEERPVPEPWRPPEDTRVRHATPPHAVGPVKVGAGVVTAVAGLTAVAATVIPRARRR